MKGPKIGTAEKVLRLPPRNTAQQKILIRHTAASPGLIVVRWCREEFERHEDVTDTRKDGSRTGKTHCKMTIAEVAATTEITARERRPIVARSSRVYWPLLAQGGVLWGFLGGRPRETSR